MASVVVSPDIQNCVKTSSTSREIAFGGQERERVEGVDKGKRVNADEGSLK
jgi:hypothetical protein